MKRLPSLFAWGWLLACGGGGQAPTSEVAAPAVASGAEAPRHHTVPDQPHREAADPHAAAIAGSDFAALVAALSARGEVGEGRCIMRRDGARLWLVAPLTAATRELPAVDPVAGLLDRPAPVVLTRYGIAGGAGATAAAPEAPLLVAVTELPGSATRVAGIVLSVRGDGSVDSAMTDARGPAQHHGDVDAAVLRVLRLQRLGGLTAYVTGASDAPLDAVYALLRALPAGLPVALTLALPAGSRLPAAADDAQDSASLCPEGLPTPPPDLAEGQLPRAALLDGVAPLRQRGAQCLATATGPAAAGGRVTVALRIGTAGQVEHACVMRDGIGDATLAACVAETARALRFQAPSPAGFLDVHLPLQLAPIEAPPLPAVCE